MTTSRDRVGAVCGIVAPVCFVGGWLLAGAQARGYDPAQDFISDLARVGAPTRPLMTAGLVGFGLLAPVWGRTLGRSLAEPRLRASVTAAGLSTLAVAALPLGASWGNAPHGVSAGVAYLAMAVTPALAGRRLRGGARWASYAVAVASATMLALSGLGSDAGGLQRGGLGVVDAWFVAMAVRELRRPAGSPLRAPVTAGA
ncbi:MAG: DUF998 domain-containing protein [Mycobacteriales bacterium]